MRYLLILLVIVGCSYPPLPNQPPGDGGGGDDSGPPDDSVTDGPPLVSNCTLLPQGGCPVDQACDLGDGITTASVCRDVVFRGFSDDECTDNTQCDAGFTCIRSGVGRRCAELCDADAQCGALSRCVLPLEFEAAPGLKACSNVCNTIDQGGCPTTFNCIPVGDGNQDYSDCVKPGNTPTGQVCTQSADCEQFSACNNAGTCANLCNRSTPTVCASDVCDPFTDPILIDGVSVGFCT